MRGLLTVQAALVCAALGLSYAAAASDSAYELRLGISDIEAVLWEDDTAWLKLTPDAKMELLQATESHQGDWLELSIDGVAAPSVRMFSPVDSGVLGVSNPSDPLRAALQRVQNSPSTVNPGAQRQSGGAMTKEFQGYQNR